MPNSGDIHSNATVFTLFFPSTPNTSSCPGGRQYTVI
jgi:hypothetical protein